jgi:hypothetical protein
VNGHTQSGGHWNVALGLVARSSGFLASFGRWSGSSEGTADGALLIMRHPSNERKVAQQFPLAAPPGRKQADDDGGPHLFLHIPRPHEGITMTSERLFKIAHFSEKF